MGAAHYIWPSHPSEEIEFVFKTYGTVTDIHVIAGDSNLSPLMHCCVSEGLVAKSRCRRA